MNLDLGQLVDLGRHLVHLAVVDHGQNSGLARAMQPDVIGQVGRTEGRVALAVGTVAGGTHRKLGLAQGGLQGVMWTA